MAETAAAEVVQEAAVDVEPVREAQEVKAPEVKPEPVVVAPASAHVATAPMTRAPAPEYVPEAPRHSDLSALHSALKAKVLPVVTVQRTALLRQLPVRSLPSKST